MSNNAQSNLAYLFPGQGFQSVGMGKDLYDKSPAARLVFEQVNDALEFSLTDLLFKGPERELQLTVNAQPAIMAVSLACMAALEEQQNGKMPVAKYMAGHSLGEYTALYAAGVLDLPQAIQLVRERGRLMQEACDSVPGAMAAIMGLDEATLVEICHEAGTQIANINSPGQIVISGERSAVEKAVEKAVELAKGKKNVKVKAVLLSVSGAFHSYLMGPALEGLLSALDAVKLRNPRIPVIANCSAQPMGAVWEIKEELAQQVCGCVRWSDTISFMAAAGVSRFVELGPGKVLTKLVEQIRPEAKAESISNMETVKKFKG